MNMIESYNKFGFDLLSQLIKEDDKNVFISPFSILTVLAILYHGSSGSTKRALSKIFNVEMMTYDDIVSSIKMMSFNSIWFQSDYKIDSKYKRFINKYYDVEMKRMDIDINKTANDINIWISDKTHQKIKNLVRPESIRNILVIIINAIYFKGLWEEPFDKNKTESKPFYLLNGEHKFHPMMVNSGYYKYHENDIFQAVCLPYKDNKFSMFLFLPDISLPFKKFQNYVTSNNWKKWMSEFVYRGCKIVIPKFKIGYSQDILFLINEKMIGPEFSKMGKHTKFLDKLVVERILYSINIEVDEEGTEMAAVTMTGLSGCGSLHEEWKIIFDRPFFCVICDNETGLIVFSGYIVCPE